MVKSENLSLKVAVFLDGSPGHEKQTLGIIKALQRLHPLEVTEIKIGHSSLWQEMSVWLRYLLGMDFPSPLAQEPYDLLIGTGVHTHIPMLSCKRRSGAFSITCMAPSRILRQRFDLCCIPQHDGIEAGKNIFLTVGPPNCSEARAGHDPNKALILLGGVDPKSHHWSSADICTSIRELLAVDTGKEWTISSSPRTPGETVLLVERIAAELDNVTFFRYQETASGWIEEQYSQNKTVWVTADSMSMVYEALSAGCKVGILPVVWKSKENKFNRSETYLLEQGLVISFQAWKQETALWNMHEPLNEAGRCAEEILRKWFQRN
jgi:mitochondrial fission protein ELM1